MVVLLGTSEDTKLECRRRAREYQTLKILMDLAQLVESWFEEQREKVEVGRVDASPCFHDFHHPQPSLRLGIKFAS